jgi:poly-gamma-glutamate synthesis protein (capsule biosynthesis protein)
MIRILVGGDIYPAGNIRKAFINGKASEIFNDLLEEITAADLSIVNLECPLIIKEMPIIKAGPVLGASIQCLKGFVEANWKVINLANNHSFDQGADGLDKTIRTIKGAGLDVIGAGMNLNQAQTPLVKQIGGQRIVLYAMAEREFSIADQTTPGANPLDLMNFVNSIRLHKQQGLFIVLLHGGKEHYPYPTPEMIRRCRFMVDMGADAVICCHSHCPLPWEIYNGKPIIYGLGNLILEAHSQRPEQWYQGYLAKLTITDEGINFEPIPYCQSKDHPGAWKMNKAEHDNFLADMSIKNAKIGDYSFIEARWGDFCRQQRSVYLPMLFGYNRIMFKMRSVLFWLLHSKKDRLRALNLVQCETHQEVLNTIFKNEKRSGSHRL